MKNSLSKLTLLLVACSTHAMAEVNTTNIDRAFIPPVSYDSNDKVELVIAGRLPGLCYELVQTQLDFDRESNTFTVKQNIKKREYLDCSEGHTMIRPKFQHTVELGRLTVGDYKVVYSEDGQDFKSFKVAKHTSTETIDENLYAPLTSAFISDVIGLSQTPRVILGGLIEMSCLEFDPSATELLYYEDVIVMLPKLKINSTDCVAQNKQIQTVVPLKRLPKGNYLLHIRTLSGGSINKLFEVTSEVPQNF